MGPSKGFEVPFRSIQGRFRRDVDDHVGIDPERPT